MLPNGLYKSYAFIMETLGFDSSISNFINNAPLVDHNYTNILDVGCGTGIIGLTLAQRYSNSSVLFTDLNESLLHQTKINAEKRNIKSERLSFGVSDITTPKKAVLTNNKSIQLEANTFDIVSTGAAIGYSQDQNSTIKTLLELVKPGGYFINLEMNEKFIGKSVSKKYKYPIMPLSEMENLIKSSGYDLIQPPLNNFPARLTRTCFIAKRA